MVGKDYITRMIQEFGQGLLLIRDLVRGLHFSKALDSIDQMCQQLAGLDIDAAANRSLTELLARLTFGDDRETGRDKCVACAAALKEAGAAYAGLGRATESSACYLQALHLMLEVGLRDTVGASLPDYAPTIEELAAPLNAYTLPSRTNATLLRYYERTGDYGKAEDALFAILDIENNAAAVELGQGFYERLLQLSDAELNAGNLPRTEVVAGQTELRRFS